MAKLNLGRVAFVLRGEWAQGAYNKLDVVSYGTTGDSYVSRVDNNTALPTDDIKWLRLTNVGDSVAAANQAAQAANTAAESATAAAASGVRTDTEQGLNDTQKATARGNIDAASVGEVSDLKSAVNDNTYVLKEISTATTTELTGVQTSNKSINWSKQPVDANANFYIMTYTSGFASGDVLLIDGILPSGGGYLYAFYDSGDNALTTSTAGTSVTGVVGEVAKVPENAVKLIISGHVSSSYPPVKCEKITGYVSNLADNVNGLNESVDKLSDALLGNLYDPNIAVDGYLIYNDTTGAFGAYADSILSGYFPVKSGKTYNVYYNTPGLYSTTLAFYNANKTIICAGAIGYADNSQTGFSNVPVLGDKVTLTGAMANLNMEINDPSIKYAVWYISKNESAGSGNYYGSHSGLTGIIEHLFVRDASSMAAQVDEISQRVSNLEDEISSSNARVTVNISGNDVQIRTKWDNTNDIACRTILNGSENLGFELWGYYTLPKDSGDSVIATTLFKDASDDIAPLRCNGSILGANHGHDRCYTITCSGGHGLTESDIGKTFTDGSSHDFVIITIKSTTKVMVVSPNNSETEPLNEYTPTGTMTCNAQSFAVTSVTRGQLRPSENHHSVKVLINGVREVSENGVYKGDSVHIVETYDVIRIPDMISFLQEHIGTNTNDTYYSDAITGKYFTMSLDYVFTERCACTVFENIEFATVADLVFVHGTQSMPIGDYYSCPACTDYQMIQQRTGDTQPEFSSDKWADADYPADRIYQYTDANQTTGFCVGFNDAFGNAKPAIRKNQRKSGYIYRTTNKVYPYLVFEYGTTSVGTMISCVAYRLPLNVYDADIPAVGWYYVGDDIYLVVDVQKTVNKMLELPDYMVGRKASVIKSFGTFTLGSEFVGASGLKIITTTFGSAVIKLDK